MMNILAVAGPIGISIAGAIYSFFASRSKAADARLDTMTKRLDDAELKLTAAAHNATALQAIDVVLDSHEKRLLAMEGEFKHLPAREDVSDLKLAISELSGTVGRLEAQVKGSVDRLDEQVGSIGRTVHRIDDYLREREVPRK
jgi:predicted  nucleic acid-binding Zn-ribbon protein